MLKKRINNWFTHFQKYFFKYKEGYFELSVLANSLEAKVESLKKIPFNKCDTKGQILTSDNFFLKGEMHYQELDDGLWLMYANIFYKTNIRFKMIYDEYLPADYFILSYNILENELFENGSKNNDINYFNETWTLSKPKANYSDSHLKGTKARYITMYFTEKWLEHNVLNDLRFNNNNFKDFFNDKDQIRMAWSDTSNFVNTEFYDIVNDIKEKGYQGAANVLALKLKVYRYIQNFFLKENKNLKFNPDLDRIDLLNQLEIEKFLIENLESKFIGIDALSKKFNISPTKLKSDFKEAYGVSLLQYFRKHQMQLAKELIKSDNIKISDLSFRFGYESPSKFSKAFLKHNGNLPSFYKK